MNAGTRTHVLMFPQKLPTRVLIKTPNCSGKRDGILKGRATGHGKAFTMRRATGQEPELLGLAPTLFSRKE